MTREEAIKFAEYAQIMADGKPGVQEFYKMAEYALRAQQEVEKNEPLTLDELREMDGEPVWVVNSDFKKSDGFSDEWALVSSQRRNAESTGTIYHFEDYGKTWLAYRRKPEEVQK